MIPVIAFAGALFVVSAAVNFGVIRWSLLDRPNARSSHRVPTPKGGGLGIIAAFLVGLAVFAAVEPGVFAPGEWLALLAGVALAAVAFIDDIRPLPAVLRLLAQMAAAGAAMAGGALFEELEVPGVGLLDFGWLAWPLTLLWIVAVTNAVNFMDGLDGLVGGVALVAALFLWPGPSPFVTTIAVLLGPALLGFLIFNTPRARLFLGDVGSQFIGFTLAVLATFVGRDTGGGMATWLLPLILAPFLVDVAYTLVRRARAGERLTEAHRGHLYQILYRVGWPHPAVAFFHWGFAAVHGGAGILAMQRPESFWWLAGGLAGLHLLYFRLVHRLASTAGIGRW